MSWSKDVSTKYHVISAPSFPDGGDIDVRFDCPKCKTALQVDSLEVPDIGTGDTKSKRRSLGQTKTSECDCRESYDVTADNSIAGWMVEFENEKDLIPKTFQYRIRRYYGETEHSTEDKE